MHTLSACVLSLPMHSKVALLTQSHTIFAPALNGEVLGNNTCSCSSSSPTNTSVAAFIPFQNVIALFCDALLPCFANHVLISGPSSDHAVVIEWELSGDC